MRATLAVAAIPLAFAAGEFAATTSGAAFAAIAAGIALASLAYLAVLRATPPPSNRTLAAGALATLAVALVSPAVFSADQHAYVAYGELLVRGGDPFRRIDAATAHAGPAVRAALDAWGGRLPADVYGPAFTVIAGLAVVATGDDPAGARRCLQLATVAAWVATAALLVRRYPERAALVALHPVALWTVAEGHNDPLWLLPAVAAFAPRRGRRRTALLTLAAAVKAAAVAPLLWTARPRAAVAAVAVLALAYAPLIADTLRFTRPVAPGVPRLSPLAILARLPADPVWPLAAAIVAFGVLLLPRAWRADRAGTAALAAWTLAPVAYPWYALWLLPLIAARPDGPVRRALFVATLVAPAGYVQDAVTTTGSPAFSVGVMLVQYAAPLAALALALAQTTPAPRPEPVPVPVPTASATSEPAPSAPPTWPPTATPSPAPSATVNPYGFIVVPSPAAEPAAAGPRITEIAVNDRIIHAGGALLARITTTGDATACVARLMGRELALAPAGNGVFTLDQQLPSGIPFWFFREYDVEIVAARADGKSASAHLKLRLTR